MKIESIKTVISTAYDMMNVRRYTTFSDHNKKSLEVEQYSYPLYNKKGQVDKVDTKGSNVDKQA